jgi:hypothetical protein
MKRNFFVLGLIAVALIFTSCGKLPQTEIDAAKTALEEAKTAQADLYLQSEFFALNDSLNAIVSGIAEQKSKMFGNYQMATGKLDSIKVQATELVAKTDARKEEIKIELASAQLAITTLLEENNQFMGLAPKGKEVNEMLEALRFKNEGINSSVSEVPVLIENGDLLNAQTKVKAAQEKAVEINSELKTAIEKTMKRN